MAEQKFENLLNISLAATPQEREESLNLGVGVEETGDVWEIIIKHTGDLRFLEEQYEGVQIIPLLNGYTVANVPRRYLEEIAGLPEVEYVEKPKRLYFQDYASFSVSCIPAVKTMPLQLNGSGVITAVIDSGINVRLPEFRNTDGSTRLLFLWDQTAKEHNAPEYGIGREYSQSEINAAIEQGVNLGMDAADHGTPVASLACGNSGVADKSDIIFVKLSSAMEQGFPRTTQIMLGIDYVIRKAAELKKPVAVNVSLGNNYGSHTGTSMLERYMDDAGRYWKSVICVGSGNEAAAAIHTSGILTEGQEKRISFSVGAYQPSMDLQIWKQYADDFLVRLILPDGSEIGPLTGYNRLQRFLVRNMEILGYVGEPSPYSVYQEIYFDLLPQENYLMSGVWQIVLTPVKIVDGRYNIWLPSDASLNEDTGFLEPQVYNTLTIPSTAEGVITVGAYDGRTDAYAPFSGRGRNGNKPTLAAPGVNVGAVSAAGGIRYYSGTSFATPIVTGSAALLMEWGIVRGNDPYLYGEKVKAYLQKGARRLPGFEQIPNAQTGYGALCLKDSIPV